MKKFYFSIGICVILLFAFGQELRGQIFNWSLIQENSSTSLFGDSSSIRADGLALSQNYAFVNTQGYRVNLNRFDNMIQVLKKNNDSWEPIAVINNNEIGPITYFGEDIAVSGDYLITGSLRDNLRGSAYIFKRQGEEWLLDIKIPSNLTEYGQGFGKSVAIFGDYAVVGNPYQELDGNPFSSGYVMVFHREGSSWIATDTLTAANPSENDRFGFSLGISGDYIVVSAPYESEQYTQAGAVYVFKRNGDSWEQIQRLVSSNSAEQIFYGFDVSISGGNILIGSRLEKVNNLESAGAAYIFELQGESWVEKCRLVASEPSTYQFFGESVTIDGNKALISAKGDNEVAFQSGATYIFEKKGGVWNETVKLKATNPDSTTFFGQSVALYDNECVITQVHPSSVPDIKINFFSKVPAPSVKGMAYHDQNLDCEFNNGDTRMSNQIIKAEPGPYYSITDDNGEFSLQLEDGEYTISYVESSNLYITTNQICPSTPPYYTIQINGLEQDTTGFDFANRITECSLLKVDINSNRRRRCFTNQTTVSYCNEGLVAAENVAIEVSFPQFVVPLSSTLAWESVQGSVYTFNIGTLEAGQCGSFVVTDSVLCEAGITGLTQCTEARIYPKNNCVAPGGDWNGAELDITGNCFTQPNPYAVVKIQNTGTGNMSEPRQYRVFFNEQLAFSAEISLTTGDSLVLQIPTQGKDLRVEIDQVAHHPTETLVSYQTPGNCLQSFDAASSFASVAMAFPPADEPAEVEIDCQTIIDSFDPNDKLVHPIGFTENRYVRPGTPLEYTLRFQNTGTAEAVNVVIIDTLSADLDMTRFQMMSASHDYKLQVSGQGRPILTWIFNNINLPDSTSNEPESHGYIKFKISPNADLAEGTIIENFADIYFDFNDPIRTNTTISNITDYQFPVAPIDFCDMVRVAEAGESQQVCENSVVLAGNVPNIGEGTWTVISGNGTFDNPNKPNAQVSNLAVGENIFQWRIESSECNPSESTVSIFYLPVNQANAGDDHIICASSFVLQGNQPVNGAGKWTLLSGQAQINNPNAPNSAIQNLGYGENVLKWSIGSALCDSTHSTVRIIRLREPSTANAGQDAIVCGETYTLQGNAPQYGTGYWTKISGAGTLMNPESPQAQVTGLTLGESIFEWRVSNGICESNASQVKLTRIAPQANAVNIQADKAAICEGEEVTFTALPQNAGTSPSYQWKVNGQNVGTNQASFTSTTLRANDMVTVEMQADLTCPSPATAISEALSITVYPRPTKANILHTQAKTLSASTTGLSYVWYKDEEVLEENTQSINVEELGTYRVEVVGTNCTSELSDAFVLDAAALSRFADGEVVLVFPNPSEGQFTVKITNNAGSSVQVTLYDAQGKTMLSASYPESNQIDFEVSLQVPASTAGNYWMRVEYKGKIEIKKLMVR